MQVAVVPKGKSIPPVSGLLAYRKENKQLYVQSNGTWTALAQKNKVFMTVILKISHQFRLVL